METSEHFKRLVKDMENSDTKPANRLEDECCGFGCCRDKETGIWLPKDKVSPTYHESREKIARFDLAESTEEAAHYPLTDDDMVE
ncbi:hypothetical protein N9917_02450 [Deltaproteobacteria bacterium]|nr:hypothetical protein [Deltaproteobacteria bacterium]